jgi:nitrate/nitrite transporter NarK
MLAVPVMPRRNRLALPWGKLLAAALLAGVAGLALGIGLAKLSNGNDPPAAATAGATTRASLGQVGVSVVASVLHPAATAFGRQRQRARLVVVVRLQNRGTRRVTIPRPALLAAGVRQGTDPSADAPGTSVRQLGAGMRRQIALQFEVAGTVTRGLTTGRRARVLVAGHTLTARVTLGPPVRPPQPPAP